jgi:signal transduction histidine kinase
MRIAAIVFPALFVIQGLLVAFGVYDTGRYVSHAAFVLTSIVFMGVAIASVLTPVSSRPGLYMRTWGLSAAGLALTLVTTGFATPLTIGLILMLYDAYRLLGVKGLLVSTLLMSIAVVIDIYRGLIIGDTFPVYTVLVIVGVVIVVGIILIVLRVQHIRQSILEKSVSQTQLERDRIATLMNNLTQGVMSIDSKGIVRTYNAATLNILDTNESLTGRHLDEILVVKNEDGNRIELFSTMQQHRSLIRDDLYYHYSDDVVRIEVVITPIRSSGMTRETDIDRGFLVLVRDITKQKNLDEERDEFISVVSHELRTPIAITEGTLSNIRAMLEKGVASREKIEPILQGAHEQIIFLARMVNDLSTLSRAERGIADDPEDIDIYELLTSLYAEYTPEAASHNLRFNLDVQRNVGVVRTSRLYLAELMQNLVTNALKYTDKGSVTIHAKRQGNAIIISVVDTGIGISKTDQKKIYEKFYRSEDYRTRETRGTGLGLYVASKLARKIDTKILLKSRINHGSEFSFAIPVLDEGDTND